MDEAQSLYRVARAWRFWSASSWLAWSQGRTPCLSKVLNVNKRRNAISLMTRPGESARNKLGSGAHQARLVETSQTLGIHEYPGMSGR